MLSPRLAKSIQDHREEIALDAIRRIRRDTDVPHMAALPEPELKDWACGVLTLLWSWPNSSLAETMAHQFQQLGRQRFETSIPLQEGVRCLHTLKQSALDFTRSRGFAENAVEVYAQEELEHRVGLLFDRLVYHVVRGYEEARKKSVQPAA